MAAAAQNQTLTEEDALRAQLYGLLARLLGAAPSQETLGQLSDLQADDSPLGQLFGELADKAKAAEFDTVEDEYNALFIGVTEGELIPYASHYITGFLNDKPLLKVRESIEELGITRADDIKEPEDHIAFLCEVMSGLILGTFGIEACLNIQKAFFKDHIAPWAEKFFTELENAQSADIYRPVGGIGKIFMQVESEAFEMSE